MAATRAAARAGHGSGMLCARRISLVGSWKLMAAPCAAARAGHRVANGDSEMLCARRISLGGSWKFMAAPSAAARAGHRVADGGSGMLCSGREHRPVFASPSLFCSQPSLVGYSF
ncbi:unnamed protein product [Prorocentrum cordatum]|uniref:Uncharacterized protein n=1 Tax=Prorocentrum cordatum TaxID=2364126 RepID=A0ABN9QTA3_9DINO|nr:unnamed protein product [Polarella glacialis]